LNWKKSFRRLLGAWWSEKRTQTLKLFLQTKFETQYLVRFLGCWVLFFLGDGMVGR